MDEETIKNEVKEWGKVDLDLEITHQASTIIKIMGDKFPMEHFKQWILKSKIIINGGIIHEYFCAKDGIMISGGKNDS